MNRYYYPFIMLAIAAVVTGCGDNKVTSKLIGTEMVNSPAAGGALSLGVNTTQSVVFKQAIKDMFPNTAIASIAVIFGDNNSSIQKKVIFPKAFKALGNKMRNSGGGGTVSGSGTLSLPVDGGNTIFNITATATATPNSSGTGGTITITDSIVTTFSGLIVAVGGSNYKVNGIETDNVTASGTYIEGNEGAGEISINFTLTATKGLITIAGPGCTGTWVYSLTDRGSVLYSGGSDFIGQMAVSGILGGGRCKC